MIKFERYAHINDLLHHYLSEIGSSNISGIFENGVQSDDDAFIFSHFIWNVVEKINDDEEAGREVLGSKDNTDMLPDLNYEISKYMREKGFYAVWEKVSNSNLQDE